jgi:HSP20 family protein
MIWRDENHRLPWLRAEVETLFGEVLGRGASRASAAARWLPSLDLIEEAGAYVVEMDMPGVRLEDLSIAVAAGRLVVGGRRELVRELAGARIRVRERWSGVFSRSVELPGPVDAERLSATLRDGILRIELPRLERRP